MTRRGISHYRINIHFIVWAWFSVGHQTHLRYRRINRVDAPKFPIVSFCVVQLKRLLDAPVLAGRVLGRRQGANHLHFSYRKHYSYKKKSMKMCHAVPACAGRCCGYRHQNFGCAENFLLQIVMAFHSRRQDRSGRAFAVLSTRSSPASAGVFLPRLGQEKVRLPYYPHWLSQREEVRAEATRFSKKNHQARACVSN